MGAPGQEPMSLSGASFGGEYPLPGHPFILSGRAEAGKAPDRAGDESSDPVRPKEAPEHRAPGGRAAQVGPWGLEYSSGHSPHGNDVGVPAFARAVCLWAVVCPLLML